MSVSPRSLESGTGEDTVVDQDLADHAMETLFPPTPEPVSPRSLRQLPRVRSSWAQRICAVGIAGLCAAVAVWYVPRVVHNDSSLIQGSVSSAGLVTLNFNASGQLERLEVRVGQHVKRGQVLATETGPNAALVLSADNAAIASDKAKLAQVQATPDVAPALPVRGALVQPVSAAEKTAELAAAHAELLSDEAQLARDRFRLASATIVAPSSGTVIATDGLPGEIVTPTGVRDFTESAEHDSTTGGTSFSLLPNGPQSTASGSGSGPLPVITLSTSSAWHVVALVPENSVSGINSGQLIKVSIPAAQISNVTGRVQEILPTPIDTSSGTDYQAVISVTGHTIRQPLNGMAVNLRL